MVLAIWVSGFGALIATWFEQWGRFGLDPEIGSCSILPDVNGHSPKEFLFILAFLAPCVAIVVCYARIFYIVRKTAIKSRRRDKAAIDLVKASLEVNVSKVVYLNIQYRSELWDHLFFDNSLNYPNLKYLNEKICSFNYIQSYQNSL